MQCEALVLLFANLLVIWSPPGSPLFPTKSGIPCGLRSLPTSLPPLLPRSRRLRRSVLSRVVTGLWVLPFFSTCSDVHFRSFSTVVMPSACFEIFRTCCAEREVPSSSTFAGAIRLSTCSFSASDSAVSKSVFLSSALGTAGSAANCALSVSSLSFSSSKCALC